MLQPLMKPNSNGDKYKMNKSVLLVFMIFLFSCNAGYWVNEKSNQEITGKFNWLVGDWQRINEKADRATYESWKRINETEYIGVGFTLQKKDTIWKENIRLIKIESYWNFEVVVENEAKPTIFKLTSIESYKFVCENQENEFPKIIEYKKENDQIKATISEGNTEILFEL